MTTRKFGILSVILTTAFQQIDAGIRCVQDRSALASSFKPSMNAGFSAWRVKSRPHRLP